MGPKKKTLPCLAEKTKRGEKRDIRSQFCIERLQNGRCALRGIWRKATQSQGSGERATGTVKKEPQDGKDKNRGPSTSQEEVLVEKVGTKKSAMTAQGETEVGR